MMVRTQSWRKTATCRRRWVCRRRWTRPSLASWESTNIAPLKSSWWDGKWAHNPWAPSQFGSKLTQCCELFARWGTRPPRPSSSCRENRQSSRARFHPRELPLRFTCARSPFSAVFVVGFFVFSSQDFYLKIWREYFYHLAKSTAIILHKTKH